jgi:hypothetical protein
MCEDITNEGNYRADCCLAANTVNRSVHLDEECKGGQCTYGPANRREDYVRDAECGEDVAARHDEKAGEPRTTKLSIAGRKSPPMRRSLNASPPRVVIQSPAAASAHMPMCNTQPVEGNPFRAAWQSILGDGRLIRGSCSSYMFAVG